MRRMNGDDPRLAYVVAWGRSGSTILGSILGSLPDAFYAGELREFWNYSRSAKRRCGCGKTLATCDFWEAVRKHMLADEDLPTDDFATINRWQRAATRIRNTPRVVKAASSGDLKGEAFTNTIRALGCLYRAIGRVSGAEVIVDSSHKPSNGVLGGFALDSAPVFIHLIRDPRATAFSWQRFKPSGPEDARMMPRHGVVGNCVYWTINNVSADRMLRRRPRSGKRVRYEDLIRSPRAVVGDLAGLVGQEALDVPFVDEKTVDLPVNHSIAGNPSRLRHGRIELVDDDEWKWRQSRSDRAVCDVLTLPLLQRYGYPLNVG